MSPLPTEMRFIEVLQTGGPEQMRLAQGPLPTPGKGEVLIQVKAAGVNRPDCFQRAGAYPPPPGASPILGLEVAGLIVAGDVENSGFQLGDRVCALAPGGGYAEYCVVPVDHCLPVPEDMPFEKAAALPEALFTVWMSVFQIGALKAGENLLVHGGASGIGTMAIQMAKALGNPVYATASTAKCALVRQLGAQAIDYQTEDFVTQAKALTERKGIHVFLDMVCGEYLDRDILCAATGARIVIIAQLGGAMSTLNAARLMSKRVVLTGATLRPQSVEAKKQMRDELLAKIWPHVLSRAIQPVVDRQLPLSEAPHAHELLESGAIQGKIVLIP